MMGDVVNGVGAAVSGTPPTPGLHTPLDSSAAASPSPLAPFHPHPHLSTSLSVAAPADARVAPTAHPLKYLTSDFDAMSTYDSLKASADILGGTYLMPHGSQADVAGALPGMPTSGMSMDYVPTSLASAFYAPVSAVSSAAAAAVSAAIMPSTVSLPVSDSAPAALSMSMSMPMDPLYAHAMVAYPHFGVSPMPDFTVPTMHFPGFVSSSPSSHLPLSGSFGAISATGGGAGVDTSLASTAAAPIEPTSAFTSSDATRPTETPFVASDATSATSQDPHDLVTVQARPELEAGDVVDAMDGRAMNPDAAAMFDTASSATSTADSTPSIAGSMSPADAVADSVLDASADAHPHADAGHSKDVVLPPLPKESHPSAFIKRGQRSVLAPHIVDVLVASYDSNKAPETFEIERLSRSLSVTTELIRSWFSRRRYRDKTRAAAPAEESDDGNALATAATSDDVAPSAIASPVVASSLLTENSSLVLDISTTSASVAPVVSKPRTASTMTPSSPPPSIDATPLSTTPPKAVSVKRDIQAELAIMKDPQGVLMISHLNDFARLMNSTESVPQRLPLLTVLANTTQPAVCDALRHTKSRVMRILALWTAEYANQGKTGIYGNLLVSALRTLVGDDVDTLSEFKLGKRLKMLTKSTFTDVAKNASALMDAWRALVKRAQDAAPTSPPKSDAGKNAAPITPGDANMLSRKRTLSNDATTASSSLSSLSSNRSRSASPDTASSTSTDLVAVASESDSKRVKRDGSSSPVPPTTTASSTRAGAAATTSPTKPPVTVPALAPKPSVTDIKIKKKDPNAPPPVDPTVAPPASSASSSLTASTPAGVATPATEPNANGKRTMTLAAYGRQAVLPTPPMVPSASALATSAASDARLSDSTSIAIKRAKKAGRRVTFAPDSLLTQVRFYERDSDAAGEPEGGVHATSREMDQQEGAQQRRPRPVMRATMSWPADGPPLYAADSAAPDRAANSTEKRRQAARIRTRLQANYFSEDMIPPSPAELVTKGDGDEEDEQEDDDDDLYMADDDDAAAMAGTMGEGGHGVAPAAAKPAKPTFVTVPRTWCPPDVVPGAAAPPATGTPPMNMGGASGMPLPSLTGMPGLNNLLATINGAAAGGNGAAAPMPGSGPPGTSQAPQGYPMFSGVMTPMFMAGMNMGMPMGMPMGPPHPGGGGPISGYHHGGPPPGHGVHPGPGSHNGGPPKNVRQCNFWRKGNCRNGDRCQYAHY
ncbi:hypothetical protein CAUPRSCDRAFT_10628 [Caulochytrium protostelioides]|uniref:Homeobox domain-containing protein n=1 Tax=Caulochytrium protostelioides TaxID=1555241 RepID=A0A4P9X110_9FUNG|nr:hypothetical protein CAUPRSCDRAFT_10628 [Caulochytrium protostelioides]